MHACSERCAAPLGRCEPASQAAMQACSHAAAAMQRPFFLQNLNFAVESILSIKWVVQLSYTNTTTTMAEPPNQVRASDLTN